MITIVSGLPRSGTSMLMQMLDAAGIPILCDGQRAPDDDNPKGYYEFERVKSLDRDPSWIGMAEGKALKVISMLLFDLPDDREYKVLFVRRSLDEILASQAAMLARRGVGDQGPEDAAMKKHFLGHLAKVEKWLKEQSHIKVLYCGYGDILSDPLQEACRISEFLGGELDAERMARAVDAALHRQKR